MITKNDSDIVYFTPIQPHRPASNPAIPSKSYLRRPIPQFLDKNQNSPEICKALLEAAKEVEDDKNENGEHHLFGGRKSFEYPMKSLANFMPTPNFRPSSAPAIEPPKQERAVLEELATIMKNTVQFGLFFLISL